MKTRTKLAIVVVGVVVCGLVVVQLDSILVLNGQPISTLIAEKFHISNPFPTDTLEHPQTDSDGKKTLPTRDEFDFASISLENRCTENMICYGVFDNDTKIRINCLTVEQGKQITTFTKVPTEFPQGYSIQCIAVDNPNEIDMLISDHPVTSNEWQRESVHPSGSNIFLHQVDESKYLTESDYEHLGTAEQRIRTTIAEINAYNPKLDAKYFVINGMPAYGTEACADCGIQTANFDDSVIKQTYDVPSKLKIISDDGIRYSFYGNVPLDDLVKLGNSLQ